MLRKEKRAPRPEARRQRRECNVTDDKVDRDQGGQATVNTAAKRSSKISSGKDPQTAGPLGPCGFSTVREGACER